MKSLFTSSKKYVIIESPSKKLMYGTKRAARGDIMVKKEMIAMLLAGGQGSRLGVLTQKAAKPAVSFGGKYRIIDFPLSNCINSGVDTVGVLTQYQPLRLNAHIGIGITSAALRSCPLTREVKAATGIQEPRTQFTRIWSTWSPTIRNTF